MESVQDIQGFYASCIEKITCHRGFIATQQMKKLGEELKMTEYGQYLLSIISAEYK